MLGIVTLKCNMHLIIYVTYYEFFFIVSNDIMGVCMLIEVMSIMVMRW